VKVVVVVCTSGLLEDQVLQDTLQQAQANGSVFVPVVAEASFSMTPKGVFEGVFSDAAVNCDVHDAAEVATAAEKILSRVKVGLANGSSQPSFTEV
jgi:hypothetical protein